MKIGIVMTIKDRPELTKQSLEDLRESLQCVSNAQVVLVDDGSSFDVSDLSKKIKNNPVAILKHKGSAGVKQSLIEGIDFCFKFSGCDIVTNLDNDVRLKHDWLFDLLFLQKKYPDHIISGFHSMNKNRDGSERHKIINWYDQYAMKESVGGINMMFNKKVYEKYILPALSTPEGNWDYIACRNSMLDNHPIIVTIPSVIQHTGIYVSSMGHNSELPDVAADWDNIELPNVTLLGLDDRNDGKLQYAADVSQFGLKFKEVRLLNMPVDGKKGYSEFMINHLHAHFDTSHVLIIQHDGYVVNPTAWDNSWLGYDYIGATWFYKDGMNVGNGGFSLRSKKLCELIAERGVVDCHPEDHVICRDHRKWLESFGIKFAPEEVANKFSIEAYGVSFLPGANKYNGQFGFHGHRIDWTGWNGHVPVQPKTKVTTKSKISDIWEGMQH